MLKHRQPKHLKQRIIAFVGRWVHDRSLFSLLFESRGPTLTVSFPRASSPVDATVKELEKLGQKLKKSNISVDIISFGEEEANSEKLEAFIKAVNKDDSSHLVTVPSGVRVLSDALMTSDMFGSGGGAGGGFNDFAGGVDPSLDPEMALVRVPSLSPLVSSASVAVVSPASFSP